MAHLPHHAPRVAPRLVAALAAALASLASADTYLTYSQDFDALPTSNTSVTGTGTINLQASITQLSSTNAIWQAARIAGTNTVPVPFNVGNGSGNTGGLYSYAVSGSTDRSLGIFASSTTTPAAGLVLVNTSAYIITTVSVSFTAEQWRSPNTGGTVNTTSFAYGFSSNAAITSSNFLSSTAMTADSSGNIVSGARTDGANYGAAANVSAKIVTLSNVQWAANTTLFIRWQDVNDADADAGLAINDLSISAVPAPGAAALVGLAGLITTRRRK